MGSNLKAEANEGLVAVRHEGPIAWVTLSRPEKSNALDRAAIAALASSLDAAEADPDVRAIAITGAGRNFCAGADLSEILSTGAADLRALLEELRDFLCRLERSRLISVAAVNGAARAGGLELALACDFIVAAAPASFGDAHLANGLLPAGGSTVRLPRAIGWQRAKWMILSSTPIDAATAEQWGLVRQIAEDDRLEETVAGLVSSFVDMDSATLGKTKRLLAMTSEQPLGVSLDAEINALEAHFSSEACQRGVAGFLAGRRRGEAAR